jgi:hypothetical protein
MDFAPTTSGLPQTACPGESHIMQFQVKVALLMTAMLALGAPVHAQSRGAGLWLSAGVGGGWARVSCDVCQTSRDLGPSAFLRVGTAIRPDVRVAGEASVWTHEVDEERENLGAVMAALYLYPRQGPLYVKGGLGYVGYRAGEDITMNGVGLQLGAGYELHLGRLALNNYVNLIGSSFGSLKSESTTIANDVSTTLLQFGVGLTLR